MLAGLFRDVGKIVIEDDFGSVNAARKYLVFSSSLSRNSVEQLRRSSAFNDAATIGGATVLEKRYGRERWRKGLSDADQAEVVRRYESELDRLEAEDYHCAPVLRRSYERTLTAYGH